MVTAAILRLARRANVLGESAHHTARYRNSTPKAMTSLAAKRDQSTTHQLESALTNSTSITCLSSATAAAALLKRAGCESSATSIGMPTARNRSSVSRNAARTWSSIGFDAAAASSQSPPLPPPTYRLLLPEMMASTTSSELLLK